MDDKILLANIERLLKAKNVSADAVSKSANRPDAIRNLRRRVAGTFNGTWTLDTLADIAQALGTSPWELLRPPGAVPSDEDFRDLVRNVVSEELNARENTALPARRRKNR
jgi:hypothetical protein